MCVPRGSSTAASDLRRAKLFNEFFHSIFIFTHTSFELPPLNNLCKPHSTIDDIIITEEEVLTTLQSLDTSKSMGTDGISPKFLRSCALSLYQPVHHLFQVSLMQATIPLEWKCHSITPIHKSADRSCVSNYRPISLLCNISKVLEQIVFNHLSKFITQNNILSVSQFGFRPNHSCCQQLLVFLHNVLEVINSNVSCDAIYLDFRKAFDSVSHKELLLKQWKVGITANT